ncbi:MAG: DNA adenine methylase [Gemmatimonadota bacterium]
MRTGIPRYSRKRNHAAAHTDEYVFHLLIPYIGNKRKLLPLIFGAIEDARRAGSAGAGGVRIGRGLFVDFFAGSGVVSRMAKQLGFRVVANDWEPYALEINRCYVACNRMPAFEEPGGPEAVFERLNALEPVEGWVARHLCPRDDDDPDPDRERMFFTRANGMRIDAIRERIAGWEADGRIDARERSCLLAPLLWAACYVSNTSGVFKGFHRGWGGRTGTALYRILSELELRRPVLYDNGRANAACRMDALELADALRDEGEAIDVAYLDPPYNQHPYGSNYHVLNSIALWDRPELDRTIDGRGGKAAIRRDWRTERRSPFNYGRTAADALRRLVDAIDARHIAISYSTDGNIPLERLVSIAARRGHVTVRLDEYKRYRVSRQRYSRKPLNIELVLCIDTRRPADGDAVGRISTVVERAERAALAAHPET